jgi:NAD(P) transhydrogenase
VVWSNSEATRGSVIGAEYACTFAALGVQVHLIDGRDMLLPFLDEDLSSALLRAMSANGIRFHWQERVTRCETRPADILLTLPVGGSSCEIGSGSREWALNEAATR